MDNQENQRDNQQDVNHSTRNVECSPSQEPPRDQDKKQHEEYEIAE